MPKEWAKSKERRLTGFIPESLGFRPKWRIALDEIERIKKSLDDEMFDDVPADAGYGMSAEFRHGLDDLGLPWAVGISSTQNVYSLDV